MTSLVTPDRTLALAAIFQAGQLVVELAQKSQFDQAALAASARSVLALEQTDTRTILGGAVGVQLGLTTLHTLLRATPSPAHKELIRYTISMAQLSQRLMQSAPAQTIIAKGVVDIQSQFEREQQSSDEFFMAMGKLYQNSLSQLEPKIIVRGAKGRLEGLATVSRVRTALFAGVRAAYLWHQLGGRRWHLMLARKSYVAQAVKLLEA